jgi:hypothetical protein
VQDTGTRVTLFTEVHAAIELHFRQTYLRLKALGALATPRYRYDGKGRCVWRSLPTHVGGEHMPQVNMTLVRKPGTENTEGAGR